MKKLLFVLSILISAHTLNAQNQDSTAPTTVSANDQEIRKTTDALVAKYALDADQAKQMYTIQVRKQRNLNQIAALQTTDAALYRAKAQNVQKGTLASIRRILRTKAQVELYQKTQSDIRALRAKKQKELAATRASKEAMEVALLAIYAE